MANTNPNARSFKSLKIIHASMCVGVLLFLAVTSALNYKTPIVHTKIQPQDKPIVYIAIAFAILAPFMGKSVYANKLQGLDFGAPVRQKLPLYISACIIRYSFLNGAALFNTAIWFLTGNVIAAAFAGLLLLYTIIIRPTSGSLSRVVKIASLEEPDVKEKKSRG